MSRNNKNKAELILALDVDTPDKAEYFVNKLYPALKIFKVGLQLFTLSGPEIVSFINKKGATVFLDLKLHDIPHTVASAVKAAVSFKVKMLTLHICGGEAMIKAAIEAADKESARISVTRPFLIGVTVLTSQEAGSEEVLRLAKLGIEWGLDGIVCSAREAGILRESIQKKIYIVTPGIRPEGKSSDDQKRTATAREAAQAGSDYLVVGRPILQAQDPLKAANEILEQIK